MVVFGRRNSKLLSVISVAPQVLHSASTVNANVQFKKNIHTSPTFGTGNYRGWGFRDQRLRHLKESMNLNWNFQRRGRGVMHNFWNYAFQDKSRQCIAGTRKEKGEE